MFSIFLPFLYYSEGAVFLLLMPATVVSSAHFLPSCHHRGSERRRVGLFFMRVRRCEGRWYRATPASPDTLRIQACQRRFQRSWLFFSSVFTAICFPCHIADTASCLAYSSSSFPHRDISFSRRETAFLFSSHFCRCHVFSLFFLPLSPFPFLSFCFIFPLSSSLRWWWLYISFSLFCHVAAFSRAFSLLFFTYIGWQKMIR